jgi:hypothetical protein
MVCLHSGQYRLALRTASLHAPHVHWWLHGMKSVSACAARQMTHSSDVKIITKKFLLATVARRRRNPSKVTALLFRQRTAVRFPVVQHLSGLFGA